MRRYVVVDRCGISIPLPRGLLRVSKPSLMPNPPSLTLSERIMRWWAVRTLRELNWDSASGGAARVQPLAHSLTSLKRTYLSLWSGHPAGLLLCSPIFRSYRLSFCPYSRYVNLPRAPNGNRPLSSSPSRPLGPRILEPFSSRSP
jgi:hypothetical protein